MSLLTSHSSPLAIAAVQGPNNSGVIGMTICPGKHQANALSGQFQRDLSVDLDLINAWGATAVVSLMSDSELSALKVDGIGEQVESRGMLWFQLPIQDQALTDEAFDRLWIYAGVRLRSLLRAGKRVLVHCRSGLGRTGLVAARLLIELGMPQQQAVEAVRQARPGTLQSTKHEKYLAAVEAVRSDAWMDRVLGCLLGGAVGDAFGYAIEFDSLDQIRSRFGEQGLTRPVFQHGKLVVSDDTQMTLFTLEGILRCTDPEGSVIAPKILEEIRGAYLDWYGTQQGAMHREPLGWLATRSVICVKRAPGNTCLSALKAGAHGGIENKINDSKGCGGVMRTAPIGFLEGLDLFDLGARAAALTHGHVDGWAPAGVLPRIVSRLIKGENKFLAVRNGFSDASEWGHVYGKAATTAGFTLAKKLAHKMRFNPNEAIRLLGEGWVGDEALAIAMYAFLSARDYTDMLIRSANHDGDSDSTASIAGQLWGAKHGLEDIPNAWIRRLDVLDETLSLAQNLQTWRRSVGTNDSASISDSVLPCIRLMEMTHELHVLGYQRIRIFPYFSPSGAYWRAEWAPASAFRVATKPALVRNERDHVCYSSAAGWAPFGWHGVQGLSAQAMAKQFVRQFPELARAGEGDDWVYAGWLTRLLGEVRKGRLPYLIADWPIDLSRGIPMTEGDPFPLPPGPSLEEIGDERGSDLEVDTVFGAATQQDGPVLKPAAGSGGEYPEPSTYDFTDLYSRTHGLVMFYHHGAPYLLQVTQLIWQQLPAQKEDAAVLLCALAGIDGKGKLGLHALLEHFLETADKACKAATCNSGQEWTNKDGSLNWVNVEHDFDLMDQALLSCAFQLSQLIERIVKHECG